MSAFIDKLVFPAPTPTYGKDAFKKHLCFIPWNEAVSPDRVDDERYAEGIPCVWLPAPRAAGVILFCHGNAEELAALEPASGDLDVQEVGATFAGLPEASMIGEAEAFGQHWLKCQALRQRRKAEQTGWHVGLSWLRQLHASCGTACEEFAGLLAGLKELDAQHKDIERKTSGLRRRCEDGLRQRDQLSNFDQEVSQRLEVLGSSAQIAQVLDRGEELLAAPADLGGALDRLEAAASYTESRYDFSDAKSCLSHFDHLRNRACILVRSALQRALESAESQVQDLLWKLQDENFVDTQVFYSTFHMIAPSFRPAMSLLHRRMHVHKQYARALDDLEDFLAGLRVRLIGGIVDAHVRSIVESSSRQQTRLAETVRQAGSYLINTASREQRCFEDFFEVRQPQEALEKLLSHLSELVHRQLQPLVLQATSWNSLVEVVDVMQAELLEPGRRMQEAALSPVFATLSRLLGDTQHRLVVFARRELVELARHNFDGDLSDLEYPAVLFQALDGSLRPPRLGTMSRSLSILSASYRVLEASAFESLAREAVSSCLVTLEKASGYLSQRSLSSSCAGNDQVLQPKLTALLDSELFLIRHLLALREQVAAFENDALAASGNNEPSDSGARDSGLFELPKNLHRLSSSDLRRSQAERNGRIQQQLEEACRSLLDQLFARLCRPLTVSAAKAAAKASDPALQAAAASFHEGCRCALPLIAAHFRVYLTDGPGSACAAVQPASVLFRPLSDRLLAAWAQHLQGPLQGSGQPTEAEFSKVLSEVFEDVQGLPWSRIQEMVSSVPRGSLTSRSMSQESALFGATVPAQPADMPKAAEKVSEED